MSKPLNLVSNLRYSSHNHQDLFHHLNINIETSQVDLATAFNFNAAIKHLHYALLDLAQCCLHFFHFSFRQLYGHLHLFLNP